ncbi:MAG: urease accessory protein UreD [Anaerolineae bacterium]|nr:urease accessory protein UreD [Anaerolineae bacterium]
MNTVGRNGTLRLAFAQHGGRTVLVERYSRPPLQVMRPIPDAAGCLNVYLLSPTGGVVQGDRTTLDLCAGAGTHALLTTQSATKVYRMPDGWAEQRIHIDVGPGAVFEYVPDAAILFADSDLRQHIEVTLHPGALLLLFEIVMPGRLARGECLQFRRYANRLVVRDDDGLVLYEASSLEPERDNLEAMGRLEGYACWGSAYLLGSLDAWNIDAAAFCAAHQQLMECGGSIGGLSPLHRNGLCARMLSDHLEPIYRVFHGLRTVIRTRHLNLPDAPLRK